jgi:hypothetical protein
MSSSMTGGVSGPGAESVPLRRPVEVILIPAIDSLRSPGILRIFGLMAGMLLSGSRPICAAISIRRPRLGFRGVRFHFTVSTRLIRAHASTDAEQLLLRPGTIAAHSKG